MGRERKKTRSQEGWQGGLDLYPLPAGAVLGFSRHRPPSPPTIPHFGADVHTHTWPFSSGPPRGAEWGLCLCPAPCPGLGAEGPSAWPGGSLGAGGSWSKGAFLVTFPWGPDTHETPVPPMDPRVGVWQGSGWGPLPHLRVWGPAQLPSDLVPAPSPQAGVSACVFVLSFYFISQI